MGIFTDGRYAYEQIGLAKNRLDVLSKAPNPYLNQLVPVDGGYVLAQKKNNIGNRAYVYTRVRNLSSIIKIVDEGGRYVIGAGRIDLKSIHQKQHYRVQAIPIELDNVRFVVTPLTAWMPPDEILTVVKVESTRTLRDTRTDKSFETSIVIPTLFNSNTKRRWEIAGVEAAWSPIRHISTPLGYVTKDIAYHAFYLKTYIGTRFYDFIYAIGNQTDSDGGRGDIVPVWPPDPFVNYELVTLSTVGWGELMFFINDATPLDKDGWTREPSKIVTLRPFVGSRTTVDIHEVDDRFDPANWKTVIPPSTPSGTPRPKYLPIIGVGSDIAYIGDGKAVAFINLSRDGTNAEPVDGYTYDPNRLYLIDLASNSWTLILGPWADADPASNALTGEKPLVSLMPGHAALSTSSGKYVTRDYGATWSIYPFIASRAEWRAAPAMYDSNKIPQEFITLTRGADAVYINVFNNPELIVDEALGKTVRSSVYFNTTGYTLPSFGVDPVPAPRYLGDEDDTAPLLPGHFGVLELP